MSLDEMVAAAVRDALRSELPRFVQALRDAQGSPAGPSEYLTTAQAASVAQVTEETIREWIRAGDLPRHSAGRSLRVRRDELEAFLDGERRGAARSDEDPDAWASEVLERQKAGE